MICFLNPDSIRYQTAGTGEIIHQVAKGPTMMDGLGPDTGEAKEATFGAQHSDPCALPMGGI